MEEGATTEEGPTTAQRLASLERQMDAQRLRISHLEELHRMQMMPVFWDTFIVDHEGPIDRTVVEDETADCLLCHRPVHFGEMCYELTTRDKWELLDGMACDRTAYLHADCMIKATRVQGKYRLVDGEIVRE